jgi:hypothetical protein
MPSSRLKDSATSFVLAPSPINFRRSLVNISFENNGSMRLLWAKRLPGCSGHDERDKAVLNTARH